MLRVAVCTCTSRGRRSEDRHAPNVRAISTVEGLMKKFARREKLPYCEDSTLGSCYLHHSLRCCNLPGTDTAVAIFGRIFLERSGARWPEAREHDRKPAPSYSNGRDHDRLQRRTLVRRSRGGGECARCCWTGRKLANCLARPTSGWRDEDADLTKVRSQKSRNGLATNYCCLH